MGNELYSRGANGAKRDQHLHDVMLRDDAARASGARSAVERAVAGGMPHDHAMQLYGHDLVQKTSSTASLARRIVECADMQRVRQPGARGPNSEWFSRMNAEEQEQYLREHPKSRQHRDAQTKSATPSASPAPRPSRQARDPHRSNPTPQPKDEQRRLDVAPSKPKLGGASAHLSPADEDRTTWPQHIQQLRLPPAWREVKISHDPDADLQAIGKDAKGRDQYVYSERYARSQSAQKFARIQDLHGEFKQIAKQNDRDRNSDDPKLKEHAECMALVMHMGLRPGSDDDTGADKKAYGASTLQAGHVHVGDDGRTRLRFVGKKGVDLDLPVPNADLARMLHERAKGGDPDAPLFPRVSGASLLDYAHGLGSGGHKTKDFRTLRGTMAAHAHVAKMQPPKNAHEYKRALKDVATHVSKILGNTPSVALSSYISPAAFAPCDHARPNAETANTYHRGHDALPHVHYGQVGARPVRGDLHELDDDETPRKIARSTIRLLGVDPRTVFDDTPAGPPRLMHR